jgi:hypothetical protein
MKKLLPITVCFAVALTAGEIMANDSLKTYRAKRDLKKSGEPGGSKKSLNKQPIFVIQQHAATTAHSPCSPISF